VKIIKKKQLMAITSLSYTTIWRLENAGKFPRRIKLSPNRVGWFEHEILEWIDSRSRIENNSANQKRVT